MRPVHEGILSFHSAQVFVFTGLSDKTSVSDSRDGTLKLLDLCTEKCIKNFIGDSGPVYGIEKVIDGRFIICDRYQIENLTARLWGLGSGVCV